MTMRRAHRQLVALTTALALLLGMGAPSVARSLADVPDAAGPWAELCSGGALASAPAQVGDAADSGEPVTAISASDCSYCNNTHCNATGLTRLPQTELLAPAGDPPRTPPTSTERRTPWRWSSARPRAPPVRA
jgi:hypothetical protein